MGDVVHRGGVALRLLLQVPGGQTPQLVGDLQGLIPTGLPLLDGVNGGQQHIELRGRSHRSRLFGVKLQQRLTVLKNQRTHIPRQLIQPALDLLEGLGRLHRLRHLTEEQGGDQLTGLIHLDMQVELCRLCLQAGDRLCFVTLVGTGTPRPLGTDRGVDRRGQSTGRELPAAALLCSRPCQSSAVLSPFCVEHAQHIRRSFTGRSLRQVRPVLSHRTGVLLLRAVLLIRRHLVLLIGLGAGQW